MASSPKQRQLNPFYIEPSQRQSWTDESYDDDYDDDWRHDDRDLNLELLQEDALQSRSSRYSNSSSPSRHSSHSSSRQRSVVNIVMIVCVSLLLLSMAAHKNEREEANTESHRHKDSASSIRRIVILGERQSGVPWLLQRLQDCYPHLQVATPLTESSNRLGFWLQDEGLAKAIPKNSTLVLTLLLNPYDWVDQMRQHPMYMPAHEGMEWHDFCTQPWTTDRPEWDLAANGLCQMDFTKQQVVFCLETKAHYDNAIYELAPDGSPYASIVNLRAAKLQNWNRVASLVNDDGSGSSSFVVHYERLVEDTVDAHGNHTHWPGLLTILQEIQQRTGLKYECDPGTSREFFAPPVGNHSEYTREYIQWMNEHVDWNSELLVGYRRWNESDIPPSQVFYNGSLIASLRASRNDTNATAGNETMLTDSPP